MIPMLTAMLILVVITSYGIRRDLATGPARRAARARREAQARRRAEMSKVTVAFRGITRQMGEVATAARRFESELQGVGDALGRVASPYEPSAKQKGDPDA